jgi:hypothetical protein
MVMPMVGESELLGVVTVLPGNGLGPLPPPHPARLMASPRAINWIGRVTEVMYRRGCKAGIGVELKHFPV